MELGLPTSGATYGFKPTMVPRPPMGGLGCDDYLAVLFGVGQIDEGLSDVFESDAAGDHRAHIDVAVGDRAQRIAEFLWVVGEYELDADLLGDREERVHGVGLHAHADHDQPGACRERRSTSSMIPGTPTASNTTMGFAVSNGEPCAGSIV